MNRIGKEDLEWVEKAPGARMAAFHGERMTVTSWEFQPQTDLPEHSHPHEQIVMLREGRLTLTVDGESRTLEPGDYVVVPPDAPHSARAEVFTRVNDVFSPPREDFK